MANKLVQSKEFTDSEQPKCLFDGENNIYVLNEAAYLQIDHVADLLGAIVGIAAQADKRTEQLYNTLSFSSELLVQATKISRD